jgi:hypothetical protein
VQIAGTASEWPSDTYVFIRASDLFRLEEWRLKSIIFRRTQLTDVRGDYSDASLPGVDDLMSGFFMTKMELEGF